MNQFLTHVLNPFFYWLAWGIIPLIVEVIPSIGSFFVLLHQEHKKKRMAEPKIWPDIVLIIPVYNSESSLEKCLESVDASDYPNEHIEVYLVNNMSTDKSFEAFARAQAKFPHLRLNWLNSGQGKSRALNLAIYNSKGSYLINIDSDGYLDKHALKNMILRLENYPEYTCLTGSILIRPEKIEKYKSFKSRLFRRIEFCEYAQAFLAGRNFASETNTMYAFRRFLGIQT